MTPPQEPSGHVHDEHCGHDHADHQQYDHQHDSGIRSISLSSVLPMDGERISNWLNALVASKGVDILRAKGIIDVHGEDRRLVFQAVHMLLEGDYQRAWRAEESRASRLVFIGRNLDQAALQAGFDASVAVAA